MSCLYTLRALSPQRNILVIVGCFPSAQTEKLVRVDGKVDAATYWPILEEKC